MQRHQATKLFNKREAVRKKKYLSLGNTDKSSTELTVAFANVLAQRLPTRPGSKKHICCVNNCHDQGCNVKVGAHRKCFVHLTHRAIHGVTSLTISFAVAIALSTQTSSGFG